MEALMERETNLNCQFCTMCETHYLDVVGEYCRCPRIRPKALPREDLLSKWQKGDFAL